MTTAGRGARGSGESDDRDSSRAAHPEPAAGKRSLVQDLQVPRAAPLAAGKQIQVELLQAQMRRADAGVTSTGERFPHEAEIQRLFGRHRIAGTPTAVGGQAAQAAGALDATAYTQDGRVAFATAPDLRTAAHEAAHVVQQRQGRAPTGGIDTPGDELEQHAAAVAERVVAGESAEPLLDHIPEGAGPTGAIQREHNPPGATPGGAAGPAGPASYAVEVDTHSIGDAFARTLSDAVLEQTIEHLSQRRHGPAVDRLDRDVASANLEILAAEAARRGQRSPALDRDAARTLIRDATAGAAQLAGLLHQLAGNRNGLRNHPVTEKFLETAIDRVTWVIDTVGASHSYLELSAGTAGKAGDGLLAMAVTRAQAALVGLAILRPWFAYLQVHDQVAMWPLLQLEHRYRSLHAEQSSVDAVFGQIAGFDPDSITLASASLPGRVAALATAFDALLDEAEGAQKTLKVAMLVQAIAEMMTLAGSLRALFTLGPPSAALSLALPGLAGSGGAAVMSQVVVSAEWIAAIHHLVQIGAISVASAAEALRTRGITAAMAQSTDLPQSVKDLLGDGPTTDGMQVTDATGAGLARPPRHHVLPKEYRQFFEERGFKGDLDIDNFTVELETAEHQAQHGGGNWVRGRKWPGEWNRLVMVTLERREAQLGRSMTAAEILERVELLMKDRGIPVRFVPYRGG